MLNFRHSHHNIFQRSKISWNQDRWFLYYLECEHLSADIYFTEKSYRWIENQDFVFSLKLLPWSSFVFTALTLDGQTNDLSCSGRSTVLRDTEPRLITAYKHIPVDTPLEKALHNEALCRHCIQNVSVQLWC